jgi:hypothetical protein
MGVLRTRNFDAVVDFAADPVTAPTRGALAERLQRAIAERFVPVGDRP